MKTILVIFALCLATTGCRQIERITTKTTTSIDSVAVSVPLPGHTFEENFAWSDSIFFEDDHIRISIVPEDADLISEDARTVGEEVPLNAGELGQPRFKIVAEIKPDTAEVKVAEKTTTTETEHIKFVKQMPGWGWLLIGGLLAIVIVFVVALKLVGLK